MHGDGGWRRNGNRNGRYGLMHPIIIRGARSNKAEERHYITNSNLRHSKVPKKVKKNPFKIFEGKNSAVFTPVGKDL